MYKITIKGQAMTDFNEPQLLHGVTCDDDFTEYFGRNERVLDDRGVEDGYMMFKFEDGKLWTITTYHCDEKLTDEELQILANYTQGQWSDGIGEGFEQFPIKEINGEEVFISPWFYGQTIEMTQDEI